MFNVLRLVFMYISLLRGGERIGPILIKIAWGASKNLVALLKQDTFVGMVLRSCVPTAHKKTTIYSSTNILSLWGIPTVHARQLPKGIPSEQILRWICRASATQLDFKNGIVLF